MHRLAVLQQHDILCAMKRAEKQQINWLTCHDCKNLLHERQVVGLVKLRGKVRVLEGLQHL